MLRRDSVLICVPRDNVILQADGITPNLRDRARLLRSSISTEPPMHRVDFILAFVLLASVTFSFAQSKTIAERLGYPADSKLLIIHADDLAVAHSEDMASFGALDRGAATSASIM